MHLTGFQEMSFYILIRPEIFQIFDNVQEVFIYSNFYPFSPFAYLPQIKNTKIKKLHMKGYWTTVLLDQQEEVYAKFSAQNFSAEMREQSLIINKL